jgi:hypothetical protein
MSQASEDLDKEIEHQQALLKTYERNLRNVEINISKSGAIVPTSLANERDEYTDKVKEIRQKIQNLEQQKQPYASSNASGSAHSSYIPAPAPPSDEDTLPMQNATGVAIYTIYTDADKMHKDRLETQLAAYTWNGSITLWDKSLLGAGADVQDINQYIDAARVILLLVSPNFPGSKDCIRDMKRAMQRRVDKNTIVIPIYIRPTDWPGAPFEGLLSLPRNKQPVSTWSRADDAWYDVAVDIRKVCDGLRNKP